MNISTNLTLKNYTSNSSLLEKTRNKDRKKRTKPLLTFYKLFILSEYMCALKLSLLLLLLIIIS